MHDESVFAFLEGYQFSDYLDYVMELLLDYAGKSEKTLVSGFKWLENCYGIDVTDYKYKYYTQRKISAYLLNAVSKGDAIALAIGFQWAKYALAFSFRPTEMGRGNTLVVYHLEIKNSEGVNEYRQDCWSILVTLATKADWRNKVIMALDEYARHLKVELDRDIVIGDIEQVHQLLSTLACNQISFIKAVERLLSNCVKLNVECDKKWAGIFTGKEWTLYKVLENDFVSSGLEYEEYENKRANQISKYGKQLAVSDILNLVHDINNILSDTEIKRDSYNINQGLELIVQQFDESRLHEFLRSFVQFGSDISIRPWIVLGQLNKTSDSVALLSFLNETAFPQKNEWLFGFFESLPEEKVSPEMLDEFIQFLHSDSDKTLSSTPYRRLRVLDKFLGIEPNIYPIACSVIYEKRQYSTFIVVIYFERLFDDQIYSPQELLSLFQNNIELL